MSITVKEKEHWKDRIGRRIERAIVELVAAGDAKYLERTEAEARTLAIAEIGGQDLVDQIRELELSAKRVRDELEETRRKLVGLVRGPTVATYGYVHNAESDWENAVRERAATIQPKLWVRDPLGQRILKLRREQEELLDTVWLATSPTQIRELWKNVALLLTDAPTPLQELALATPPAAE